MKLYARFRNLQRTLDRILSTDSPSARQSINEIVKRKCRLTREWILMPKR